MVANEQWRRSQLRYDSRDSTYSKYTHVVIRTGHRLVQRLGEELASRHEGLTVLDVGCGWADFYFKLRHVISMYIGVEPSETELLRAPSEAAIRLVRGVGEHLPVVDGCVDLALLIASLDHCLDAEQTLDEVFRVLRPGGTAILLLENRGRISNDCRRLLGSPIDHGDHLYYFDVEDIRRLLEARGRVQYVRSYGFLVGFDTLAAAVPGRVLRVVSRLADAVGSNLLPSKGQHFVMTAVKSGSESARAVAFMCPSCGATFQWTATNCTTCGRTFRWIAPTILDAYDDNVASRPTTKWAERRAPRKAP